LEIRDQKGTRDEWGAIIALTRKKARPKPNSRAKGAAVAEGKPEKIKPYEGVGWGGRRPGRMGKSGRGGKTVTVKKESRPANPGKRQTNGGVWGFWLNHDSRGQGFAWSVPRKKP